MAVPHIQDYEKYHGAVIMKLLQAQQIVKLILVEAAQDAWGAYDITLRLEGYKAVYAVQNKARLFQHR